MIEVLIPRWKVALVQHADVLEDAVILGVDQ